MPTTRIAQFPHLTVSIDYRQNLTGRAIIVNNTHAVSDPYPNVWVRAEMVDGFAAEQVFAPGVTEINLGGHNITVRRAEGGDETEMEIVGLARIVSQDPYIPPVEG